MYMVYAQLKHAVTFNPHVHLQPFSFQQIFIWNMRNRELYPAKFSVIIRPG